MKPDTLRRGLLKGVAAAMAYPMFCNVASPGTLRTGAMGDTPFTRRLANYINGVRFEDLDPAVVTRAKEQLLYHVGIAFRGAMTEKGRQAVKIARSLSNGRGQTTIIGHSLKAPPLESAFTNSMFMRAHGFDDVVVPVGIHAGLLTIPVGLSLAEQYRRSGKELITAVVTGYEVVGKMVTEQDDGRAPRRPSMPFGPFASATVAAMLMQLDPAQTANAIGYAADTAMGLKAGNEQQPTHVYGWIARNAITAAVLAQAGGETSPTILEEKYGFYKAMTGKVPDIDAVMARLGKDPEILRATQKRYPGTAMNIVAIELARELITRHRLTAANVARVEMELADWRKTFETSTSTGPYTSRTKAESSIPFQMAMILLDGRQDPTRYDQFKNPEILAVTNKIAIRLAPHTFEKRRFARIRITTTDGKSYQKEGHNYVFKPLDGEAWLRADGEKFVSHTKLKRFSELVRDLENVADVKALMAQLVPA